MTRAARSAALWGGVALWGCAQALGLSEYEADDAVFDSTNTADAASAGGAAAESGAASDAGETMGGARRDRAPDAAVTLLGAASDAGPLGACGAVGQACCSSGEAPCESYLRCDPSLDACVTCGRFEGLGTLPGDAESEARAVSGDGRVGVGQSSSGPFRWTRELGLQPLAPLPGQRGSASAKGVSGDGRGVIGDFSDAEGVGRAFRWEEATGGIDLGLVPGIAPGVFAFASANAVSRDGRTIVGEATGAEDSIGQAFLWTAESGMINLATTAGGIGGAFSAATAVSADGSAVIGWATNEEYFQRPFVWSASARQTLRLVDFPLGSDSVPTATDATGDTVAGYFEIRNSVARGAFRWTRETGRSEVIELDGRALGVSATGVFVVGAGREGAFVWSPDAGSRTLSALLGSIGGFQRLEEASGVSDDGRVIAGWGMNELGAREGWVASFEGCAAP